MLVNHRAGFGFTEAGLTLLQILTLQGLTSGLLFALDAGDIASYGGSGQVWSDTSGAANHFNRGLSSSSESSDPTFNGTAGGLSENEYFSCDGGDYFSLASGTFDDGWSKNNGVFTMGAVIRPATLSGLPVWMGNGDASAFNGVIIRNENGPFRLYYDTADAAGVASQNSVATGTAAVPNLCIAGIDEAATTLRIKVNRVAAESYTSTASALTNNPQNLAIGAWGNGNQPIASGGRIYMAFAWSRLLSAAEMDALGAALATRFPSMP